MSRRRRPQWHEQGNWKPSAKQRATVACVAEIYGLTVDAVTGKSRAVAVMTGRQVACWALRKLFPMLSYPMIGYMMGNRDHSTIIHAVRKVEQKRAASPEFASETDAVLAAIADEIQCAIERSFAPERLAAIAARAFAERGVTGPLPPAQLPEASPATAATPSPLTPEEREAALLAAIQEDVDAEADALLAREPAEPVPFDGRGRSTYDLKVDEIARRREQARAQREARERFWLGREAKPLGGSPMASRRGMGELQR